MKKLIYLLSLIIISLTLFTINNYKELNALKGEKGIQYQTSVRLVELYTSSSYLNLSDDERLSLSTNLYMEADKINSYGSEWTELSEEIKQLSDSLLNVDEPIVAKDENIRKEVLKKMALINNTLEDDPLLWFDEFSTLDNSESKFLN